MPARHDPSGAPRPGRSFATGPLSSPTPWHGHCSASCNRELHMSMSIGAVGSSYPIAGAKHDKPEDSALTALTSTITPTTTDLPMVPESALVRISTPADFQEGAVAWTSDGDALAKARAAGAYGLASLDAPVEPLRGRAPPGALRGGAG